MCNVQWQDASPGFAIRIDAAGLLVGSINAPPALKSQRRPLVEQSKPAKVGTNIWGNLGYGLRKTMFDLQNRTVRSNTES